MWNDVMGRPFTAWGDRDDGLPSMIETDTVVDAVKHGYGIGVEHGAVQAFNAVGSMSLLGLVRWWFAFRRLRRRRGGKL